MQKFWNWIRDDSGGRVLRLEGTIGDDPFYSDAVTPQEFRDELYAEDGDITLWINSVGGNVFAAAEIYTMLRDYPGKVTVKIGSIAASAASVVAMAGDKILMSPVSMLMIHDPMTVAMGNEKDLMNAINTLRSVKASIVNAYEVKTGLPAEDIGELMSNETWLDAKEAVEKGFADKILYTKNRRQKDAEIEAEPDSEGEPENVEAVKAAAKEAWKAYYARVTRQLFINWLGDSAEDTAGADEESVKAASTEADVELPKAGVTEESDIPDEENGNDATVEDTDHTIPETTEVDTPPAEDKTPPIPIIGMDGKTEDGSMPYEILRDRLEWMR